MTRERGAALLLVLWVTVLLATLLAGVAAASRSHSQAALYGSERVRAELAAEAGLAHAVAGLRAPDLEHQWIPDGRPYRFDFDGAKVTVAVVDANGLLDLNAASPALLRGLFEAAGVDALAADRLAQTVAVRRGGVAVATQGAYRGAALPGVATGQAHGPFRTIDQLARLPGVDQALFAKLAPAVTVFSGRNYADASYAGPLVLAALRGIDVHEADTQVAQRRAHAAQPGAGNGQALGTVANGPLVAGYGGMVERIFSVAEMPDGTHAGVDATIRLALMGGRARPYKVLDWRPEFDRNP